MRWLPILLLVGLLPACASERPLTTDLVKDSGTAITRAKNECVAEWNIRVRQSAGWHAELRGRKWEVWLGRRACPTSGATVSAIDGTTNCTVCVG